MEGFDKICVSHQQIINYDLDFQEVGHNGAEEYIRKDALIEWLDGKMTIEGATEGFVGGYDTALKDVIDHINKM